MSSMALDNTYKKYQRKAAFFVVHIAKRDPQGYWLNIAGRNDLRTRARQARDCPSTQGLTVPRLIDDLQGTGDALYRAFPFRVCVVDIDGNISYHSPDGDTDHANPALHKVIAQQLDALFAHGGRVSAQAITKYRCDRPGAEPAGCWLPKIEYFTGAPGKSAGKGTVKIIDAQGYVTEVTPSERDRLQFRRSQVVRFFTPGLPAPKKPVVLIFVNGQSLPGGKELTAWYQRSKSHADFYLIYSATGTDMKKRANAAAIWHKSAGLPMPCLLDGTENDATFAYGGTTPRLVIISNDNRNNWAIRYISRPGNQGFSTGVQQAARVLAKLH